ncbi:hypothetical protein RND71_032685 [Anisodus tanguticus]|uniref:Uncharacterized protein n=1 Tax=Anisodus tanguticus TaxID=243964 RepID=A0AAE1V0P8_9SOLA|nr:hypothetical protein RND71_032685 [Anisodus tanguticus]
MATYGCGSDIYGSGRGGAGASGSTLKLTTTDALSYLKEVKNMFPDQVKYHMFIDVMKDFRNQRIDIGGVIARKHFHNDDHVYKSSLDILNMYRKVHKGINEMYHEVTVLFDDHPDLLDEFTRYFPDSAIANPFPLHRIIDPLRDLDLDDDKTLIKLHKEQKRRSGKESRDGRTHDQDYKELDNENEGDLSMQCLTDKMKSVLKVEEFGGPHEDKNALMKCCFMYAFVFGIVLLSLVSNLLNMICSILPDTYSQGFTFCEKVNERLRSPADYRAFLKCLHIYSREVITRKELQNLVADVLGKYPDLMEGFNEFIERYERVVGFLVGVMSQRKSDEGHTSKLVKEEEKEDRAQV